jgi:type I restriction enzyme S subunit
MTLPRYPHYKEIGIDWIGQVPAHWSIERLKNVVRFSGGGTPARDNPEYWGGDIPWISPKDMKAEAIVSSEESITKAGLAGGASSLVPPGRLLMVVRSGILKHTIPVGMNRIPVALNQDMKALHPLGIRPDFLLRWVQGLNDQLLLIWAKQGATVESIEHDYLANTLIPCPPEDEQHTIAAYLDRETARIDALIAEQERLLALLAEKRQAVISHAVNKGLNPDAPMKDSGLAWLGEVPAHWDIVPLRYVSKIGNGSTPSRDNPAYWAEAGTPWLNSSVVNKSEVTSSDQFVTPAALRECHLPVVTPPAILVGITGQGRTRGMASPLRFEATISQHIAYVKPFASVLDVEYLQRFFECAYLRLREESDAAGSTKGAITCDQLSRLKVPVPPIHEQVEIAVQLRADLARVNSLSDAAISSRGLLLERRAALITAAVTGKIDVREAS